MMKTDEYSKQDVKETLKKLDVDSGSGLSEEQVQKRLEDYGHNRIVEKEETLLHRIFRRFWGPIPWMIEIAAILSALVRKWEDFVIISIMLLANAFIDFYQESKALNALKTLKQSLAKDALVKRNGEFKSINISELVPGDIIKLKIGDIVPADLQLFEGDYIQLDESALTGESLPVSKNVNDVAYANTIVKQGEMLAVVVNTGMRTNFSSVVSLVAKAEVEQRSHFQKMVIQIGNFLILLTIVLVVLIIMVSLFRHESFLEILRFSLVLSVAAIPVALPAVLSVTMVVGALNLARHKAIVSKLTAIEELAGVDIFCSDKTGTLTKNEMEVSKPVVFNGHTENELFMTAALASRRENKDPIEIPIFQYLEDNFPDTNIDSYKVGKFTPFDPVRKRTEAEVSKNGRHFKAIKGAAQVLLGMTELDEKKISDMQKKVDELASSGYRTIAVGTREGETPLELVGLIPLYDPPREDSKGVISEMKTRGVKVKMVTGDNMAIAREIGSILGLEKRTMSSGQLSGTAANELLSLAEVLANAMYRNLRADINLREAREFAKNVMQDVHTIYDTSLLEKEFVHTHESAIVEMIEDVDIFAEVVPEDKYRIVDTLQKGGHIVAMTGDGVNDAPALKKADCGFAVSNATDAARSAADVILTVPGLGVINEAIKQARITFERMKSYAIYRIAETMRIILFMTLSIVVFDFYPITALMIILLALLNDIPILAIAYDNARVFDVPIRWKMTRLLTISSILGVIGLIASFLLFFLLENYGFSREIIQTWLFLKLIVAGHSTLYVTRSESWFWKRPWPSWILFTATFATEIFGTIIAAYGIFMKPIGLEYALMIWGYAILWFFIADTVKVAAVRLLFQEGSAA